MAEEVKTLHPLVSYIQDCFNKAKQVKLPIEERMLRNLYVIRCQYTPQKLAEIRELGGSEIYLPLGSIKVRALKAWLTDIFFSSDEPPFDIEPTPVPELSSEIEEEIKNSLVEEMKSLIRQLFVLSLQSGGKLSLEDIIPKIREEVERRKKEVQDRIYEYAMNIARREKKRIYDQFVEGGFFDALDECLYDLAIFPTVIMKSCVPRIAKVFSKDRKIEKKVIPTYNRVSPFDIYPSPSVADFSDWVIEILHLTPQDLAKMKEIEGYSADSIDYIISLYGDTGYRIFGDNRTERYKLEGKSDLHYSLIDVIEFWGPIKGELLKGLDIDIDIDIEDNEYYEMAVWVCDDVVLRATVNPDPFGNKPYHKASFIELPDSFWGLSLIDVLYDLQMGVNALARAIINNSALSSGPMVERNIDRVPAEEEKIILPWKIFDSTGLGYDNSPAYRFYQPQLTANALVQVIMYFMKLADELSGIPAYAHGDVTVSGAGRCLTKSSEVITPQGVVNISEIKVGDKVATIDGSFTEVIGVYPQPNPEKVYRIIFSDGSEVECTGDHLWVVYDSKNRKRVLTTEEIINAGVYRKVKCNGREKIVYNWRLPKIEPIQFPYRPIKVDPYTMGLYIGDGSITKGYVRLTVRKDEYEHIVKRIPYRTNKPLSDSRGGNCYHIGIPHIGLFIREYGLEGKRSSEKFIPDDYLYNHEEIRKELLRGLIDSDGYITSDGSIVFTTTSEVLIQQIRFLVKSLGGRVWKVHISEGGEREFAGNRIYKTRKTYHIYINVPFEIVSYIPHKQERYKKRKIKSVYIKEIIPVSELKEVICIKVSHESAIFLCNECIPTHNTASGLSLLMAQASRGIKEVVKNIDRGIIEPAVRRTYYFNVIDFYGLEEEIPDLNIRAKGSVVLMEKVAQAQRMLELLQLTNNPVDLQLVGAEGRKYLLERVFKNFGVEIPFQSEVQQMIQSLQQQLMQGTAQVKATAPARRREKPEGITEEAQEHRLQMLETPNVGEEKI